FQIRVAKLGHRPALPSVGDRRFGPRAITTFRRAHRQLPVWPRGTSMVARRTTKWRVGCSKLIIPQNFLLGRAGRPSVLILKFLFQLLCGWREQKRPMEARMLSADMVQRKGLELALRAWIAG